MDNHVKQLHVIPLDRDLRELTSRGTPDFPVAMYDNTFSEFLTGRVPWHWHAETELLYLLSGTILLRCGEHTVSVGAGTGAFINANTLHSMSCQEHGAYCRMISIAFSPSIIAGLAGGVCQTKYIEPLENCKQLPFLTLSPDIPYEAEMLNAILAAFAAYEREDFAYELTVTEQLMGVWRRIVTKHEHLLHIVKPDVGDERIKQMLAFLQQNFANRLTLGDIAESAHISERACTRCFKEKLHTTPFTQLTALRVRAAAKKLRYSDMSIGEIAGAVGFDGESYFCKVFKRTLGCSPREYRNRTAKDASYPAE